MVKNGETESDSGSKRKSPKVPGGAVRSQDKLNLGSGSPSLPPTPPRRLRRLAPKKPNRRWRGSSQVSRAQALMVFFRGLATLMASGVPVTRSVQVLLEQCEHRDLHQALQGCGHFVEGGRSLSEAMKLYPVFSPLQVSLVALGEQTGSLPQILERIAAAVEKGNSVTHRIKSALLYPGMIAACSLLMLVVIPALIFPTLATFFAGLHTQIPWETRLLLGFFRLVGSWPVWLGLATAVLGAPTLLRQGWVRRRLDHLLDRVPGLARLRRVAGMAEISRSLALTYNTGVPIIKALDLAAGHVHGPLKQAMGEAKEFMLNGAALNQALESTGYFPRVFIHLVAAGEEVGKVAPMLERAADLADEMVDDALAVAVAGLQPLVLGLVGLWVGAIVIAMIAPMVEVAQRL